MLAEVRRERPLISAWLQRLELQRIENGLAIIGYAPGDAVAAESCQLPNNRKLLEEIFARMAGSPLQLKYVESKSVRPAEPVAPGAAAETPRDPMDEFKSDPLIRKALELFKAEIQTA